MVALMVASLKVQLLPFRRITSAILRHETSQPRPVDLAQLRWAVQAAARRCPLRTKCIEMAIALQAMLRRRGVSSTLHYGVRRGGEGLAAHVWLSVGDELVLGGEAAPDFACVAAFSTPVGE
jgi:NADPH-dependent 2,4-dienoyl-CoA reductase/sulfur reductase-like enzyme